MTADGRREDPTYRSDARQRSEIDRRHFRHLACREIRKLFRASFYRKFRKKTSHRRFNATLTETNTFSKRCTAGSVNLILSLLLLKFILNHCICEGKSGALKKIHVGSSCICGENSRAG